MSGNPAGGRGAFSSAGIAGDHGALERVAKAGRDALLIRAVIREVFVQFRGDAVLDRLVDGVAGESGAEPFSEAGGASAVFTRMSTPLIDGGTGGDARGGVTAYGGSLPTAPIRMSSADGGGGREG